MTIIEIKALSNGTHRNQRGDFDNIPKGWAVIPEGMEVLNFPHGEVTVEEKDGILTVTSWTPGDLPEPEPEPVPEATADELLDILLGGNE